jgi:hypothetical protein
MNPATSPVGLTARCRQRPCPECGSPDIIIAAGDEMICAMCDRHRGRISQRTRDAITGIIRKSGRPTRPIVMRIATRDTVPV